jgi:hypothetical protein
MSGGNFVEDWDEQLEIQVLFEIICASTVTHSVHSESKEPKLHLAENYEGADHIVH